jgi:hypothetical protein
MSVVIHNITESHGGTYGKGTQTYTVGINRVVFCTVEHEFEDGLASLLRASAEALEEEEDWKNILRKLEE